MHPSELLEASLLMLFHPPRTLFLPFFLSQLQLVLPSSMGPSATSSRLPAMSTLFHPALGAPSSAQPELSLSLLRLLPPPAGHPSRLGPACFLSCAQHRAGYGGKCSYMLTESKMYYHPRRIEDEDQRVRSMTHQRSPSSPLRNVPEGSSLRC